MFKNKMLLVAALFFVGVSFCGENEEPDSTMFQRVTNKVYSACKSPIVPILATVIVTKSISSSFGFEVKAVPGVSAKVEAGYCNFLNPFKYAKLTPLLGDYLVKVKEPLTESVAALTAYCLTRLIPGQNDLTKNFSALAAVAVGFVSKK